MTDYELVKNKDYIVLWKRYEGLMMSFFKKIPFGIKSELFEDFYDFKCACFEPLKKAVDSIKLERIKTPETWTLYIQFYRYLQNYTTRDVIKNFVKQKENTYGFEDVDYGVDDKHRDLEDPNDCYAEIFEQDFYKTLMPEEKFIFDSRLENKKWKEIEQHFNMDYRKFDKARKSLKQKILDFYKE